MHIKGGWKIVCSEVKLPLFIYLIYLFVKPLKPRHSQDEVRHSFYLLVKICRSC